MASDSKNQQGAAFGPPLLGLKQITKLCNAATHMFNVLYDLERAAKEANKARAAKEMAQLDLFGLTANKVNAEAEEYQPDSRDWCS